jgi:hypothetical protein
VSVLLRGNARIPSVCAVVLYAGRLVLPALCRDRGSLPALRAVIPLVCGILAFRAGCGKTAELPGDTPQVLEGVYTHLRKTQKKCG